METTPKLALAEEHRHTMLPLLVVLFLISYVLLTTLVVLQDRTIDSQRSLIHILFRDTGHLAATKAGLHGTPAARSNPVATQNGVQAKTPSPEPSAQVPSKQVQALETPSAQAQATQAPSTQVPVIQAKPEASAKAGQKSRKLQKAPPSRPPAQVTDPSDMRRVSISI